MTFIVLGAAGRIGNAVAFALAEAGHDVVITASDQRDLEALAADITARTSARARSVVADVGSGDFAFLDRLGSAVRELGPLDGIICPVGAARPDDDGTLSPSDAERLVRINLLSIVATVSRFSTELIARKGVVVGFGSIAAARGRGTNVVYAAAKRGLVSFFESLRHRYPGVLKSQLYMLGYMASGAESPTPLPKGDPRALAGRVVRDLGRDVGTVYYPGWWRYVALVLTWLPWVAFRRLSL